MKPTFYLFIFLIAFSLKAQTTNSEIITLTSNEEKEILIPAFLNDTIQITVSPYKSKKAKKNTFLFYKYPSKLLLKNEEAKSFEHTFTITADGIYKLVLKNENSKTFDYSVNYTVTSTRKKKPKIGYKVQRDTTYGPEVEQLVDHIMLETKTIQNEKYYLNSTSNALLKGGKNRIIVPVNLPSKTKEWYYVFSASREEKDINNTLSTFNLASQLTKFIKEDEGMQGAVSNLSPPPGANICDIYVINDDKNANLFKEKEDFASNLNGSRENFKSGIVTVSDVSKSYLGIRNPDNLYGIHIAIEIIAVVENTEKIKELVNIPIITSYEVPYLIE
ncbi:hypothetical protein KO500_14655 [Cellulophaga baltica]|uniref:hypothetical protein n=1 Tax=Cellulophaga TaxID=104264 RepID=UPI001C07498C|nr:MULTISPECIES: hypothetical protein [Cellulophaga]MBU2997688.1 hypothetical protein [Cellulophaga baltica]MDO6769083.1 hypothetical protein [Cellulophaga sp. 1_MG-2023]